MHRIAALSLLLLGIAAASASPASADLVFRGSVSGTFDQQWKVDASDPDAGDCVTGGGEQAVQFKTAPRLLLHGGIQSGGNPSPNGREWQFGPFKVTGTVSRTDNTRRESTGDCSGAEPLPKHDCGGPRKFAVKRAWIHKFKGTHKARFQITFDGFDPAALFEDTHQCFAPDADLTGGYYSFSARWPGDRRIRPHHGYTIAGSEFFPAQKNEPFYLPYGGSVPLDINTALPWKAVLRAKCYAAGLSGSRCQ